MNGGRGGVDRAVPWPTGRPVLPAVHVFISLAGLPPGPVRPLRPGTCFGFVPAPDCVSQKRARTREWKLRSRAVARVVCVCACVCMLLALPCRVLLLSKALESRAVGLEKNVTVSCHSFRLCDLCRWRWRGISQVPGDLRLGSKVPTSLSLPQVPPNPSWAR